MVDAGCGHLLLGYVGRWLMVCMGIDSFVATTELLFFDSVSRKTDRQTP
jgi:hypothetical protein